MTSIEKNIHYTRLPSGLDVALLPTKVHDLVTAQLALGAGAYTLPEKEAVVAVLSDLLPSGTRTLKRSKVREQFEALGAMVTVSIDALHIVAQVTARRDTFVPAFSLLCTTLSHPVFTKEQFKESVTGWRTGLEYEKEDTTTQANIALARALYRQGHPHWSQTSDEKLTALARVTFDEVVNTYPKLLSTVGGLLVVAGDINPASLLKAIERACAPLPVDALSVTPKVHPERLNTAHRESDIVIPQKDKMNVDTVLAIPLTLTRDHTDFEPLSLGVAILGGSASSRLFNELRTRQSLTYGAYASLAGFRDGYPGFLSAYSIFPADMFLKGRRSFRVVVKNFIERGVTANELRKRKEEFTGRYVVGLSTTQGLGSAVFDTLLAGKPLSHIDELPVRVAGYTLGAVNRAIHTHVRYRDVVTAAAGAVTHEGKPLV